MADLTALADVKEALEIAGTGDDDLINGARFPASHCQFQISTRLKSRRLCLSGPARSSYRRGSAPLVHPDNHGDLNLSRGHFRAR